jgi:hypothetical protein
MDPHVVRTEKHMRCVEAWKGRTLHPLMSQILVAIQAME